MRVRVTKSHINRGFRGDPKRCPLALAVRDLVRPDVFIHVGSEVEFYHRGTEEKRELPLAGLSFVLDYDAFGAYGVSATSFELDIPAWAMGGVG